MCPFKGASGFVLRFKFNLVNCWLEYSHVNASIYHGHRMLSNLWRIKWILKYSKLLLCLFSLNLLKYKQERKKKGESIYWKWCNEWILKISNTCLNCSFVNSLSLYLLTSEQEKKTKKRKAVIENNSKIHEWILKYLKLPLCPFIVSVFVEIKTRKEEKRKMVTENNVKINEWILIYLKLLLCPFNFFLHLFKSKQEKRKKKTVTDK